jgi:hypothetical protein
VNAVLEGVSCIAETYVRTPTWLALRIWSSFGSVAETGREIVFRSSDWSFVDKHSRGVTHSYSVLQPKIFTL